jgi:hypothetical protein
LLYDKGLLRQTIPQQSQHSAAAFYAAGAHIHPTNLAQTFAQAQTAAFWATYNGTARAAGGAGGGGGLAGAAPGRAGAGLAGARPFLFVPGAPAAAAAASQFGVNGFNLNGLLNRQFTPRFGFQQHPFSKF